MADRTIKRFNKRNLPAEVRLTVKTAQQKKGEEICVLDLRELSSFTDFFIIMQGNSTRQNAALCEAIESELKKTGARPFGVEGKENAEWILMDYGHLCVHIFSGSARAYYSLEKLWGDAPRIRY